VGEQPSAGLSVELGIRGCLSANEEYSMTGRPELPRIRSIKAKQNYKIEVSWQHDETSIVDFRQIIFEGGVFDALRDQDFFATVKIGDRGRSIEWYDPINKDQVLADYDADSLIGLADRQRNVSSLERLAKMLRNLLVHRTTETAS